MWVYERVNKRKVTDLGWKLYQLRHMFYNMLLF